MTDIQLLTTHSPDLFFNPQNSNAINLTYYYPFSLVQPTQQPYPTKQTTNMPTMTYLQYDQPHPVYFVTLFNEPVQYNNCIVIDNAYPYNNLICNLSSNTINQENKEQCISDNPKHNNETISTNEAPKSSINDDTPKISTYKTAPKIRKQKRFLPRLPKKAEKVLNRWYVENYYDPYPMPNERVLLAKECGINVNQLNYWFKKARKRQSEVPCKFSIEIERALLRQRNGIN
jgi:hypothetical protein